MSENQLSRRKFIKTTAATGLALGSLSAPSAATEKSEKKSPPICIFSKHLQWLDYPDAAQTAKDLGFDSLDLTVRPRGHVLPERVSDDLPRAAEGMRKAGMQPIMMTTAIQRADEPHAETILKTASELGFKYYRMGWYKYDTSKSIHANLDLYRAWLHDLAGLNKQYNIRAAYQNHSGAGVGSAVWDIHYLLENLEADWIGVQYDIRHATVEGGNSWKVGLRLLAPWINTLDIKDFVWRKEEKGWHAASVPVGEGMVDYAAFLPMLKDLNVSVPYSIHYEYPLGGANKGKSQITIPKAQLLRAFKQDLSYFRAILTANH